MCTHWADDPCTCRVPTDGGEKLRAAQVDVAHVLKEPELPKPDVGFGKSGDLILRIGWRPYVVQGKEIVRRPKSYLPDRMWRLTGPRGCNGTVSSRCRGA